ncbi:hypothetical protein HELRODRAFT_165676 [Helobdella robusta]|uniref:Uncharacterized protein n=1 Tax=Helobdella robusta TaxID=6412 RepID=T1EX57_HELRO|nr:hypothetical protein HELRODRAFT_165676 [Helobdella robusta]ESN91623.1 hypothetical protein HELRODRAFT_165676 [Helobdella robusta]
MNYKNAINNNNSHVINSNINSHNNNNNKNNNNNHVDYSPTDNKNTKIADDNKLRNEEKFIINKNSLTISNFNRNDIGLYTCLFDFFEEYPNDDDEDDGDGEKDDDDEDDDNDDKNDNKNDKDKVKNGHTDKGVKKFVGRHKFLVRASSSLSLPSDEFHTHWIGPKSFCSIENNKEECSN